MNIVITNKTTLREMQQKIVVFPELIQNTRKKIKNAIDINVFDFFGMTVSEFLQLQEKKMPQKVEKFIAKKKTTFFDYIRILNAFEIGTKNLERILKDTTMQNSPDEDIAKVGLIEITPEESMLTFLCDYFKLQSLEKAQSLTLYEYITARKVVYNNAKFQRNLINLQKNRIKH